MQTLAITGIVLILTFVTNRAEQIETIEFNTVGIMFGVAFGYFVQTSWCPLSCPESSLFLVLSGGDPGGKIAVSRVREVG